MSNSLALSNVTYSVIYDKPFFKEQQSFRRNELSNIKLKKLSINETRKKRL
jgi:hypothetical protein